MISKPNSALITGRVGWSLAGLSHRGEFGAEICASARGGTFRTLVAVSFLVLLIGCQSSHPGESLAAALSGALNGFSPRPKTTLVEVKPDGGRVVGVSFSWLPPQEPGWMTLTGLDDICIYERAAVASRPEMVLSCRSVSVDAGIPDQRVLLEEVRQAFARVKRGDGSELTAGLCEHRALLSLSCGLASSNDILTMKSFNLRADSSRMPLGVRFETHLSGHGNTNAIARGSFFVTEPGGKRLYMAFYRVLQAGTNETPVENAIGEAFLRGISPGGAKFGTVAPLNVPVEYLAEKPWRVELTSVAIEELKGTAMLVAYPDSQRDQSPALVEQARAYPDAILVRSEFSITVGPKVALAGPMDHLAAKLKKREARGFPVLHSLSASGKDEYRVVYQEKIYEREHDYERATVWRMKSVLRKIERAVPMAREQAGRVRDQIRSENWAAE